MLNKINMKVYKNYYKMTNLPKNLIILIQKMNLDKPLYIMPAKIITLKWLVYFK
jgi:hypothetical protein